MNVNQRTLCSMVVHSCCHAILNEGFPSIRCLSLHARMKAEPFIGKGKPYVSAHDGSMHNGD